MQVLKYLPYKPPSPFGEEDGFSADAESGSPFQTESSDGMFESEVSTDSSDAFDVEEEVKEPVKRKKKTETPNDDDDDIEDIISSWGSGRLMSYGYTTRIDSLNQKADQSLLGGSSW